MRSLIFRGSLSLPLSFIVTTDNMNRYAALLIAGIQCVPVEAFSSSLDFVSASSRTQTLPSLMASHHNLMTSHNMTPLAFAQRNPSSSRLSFSAADSNEGNDEPWIRPAFHNTPMFRGFAILYALLFAVYQSSSAPTTAASATLLQRIGKHVMLAPKAAATLHVLSFGTWFGTVVYTTFVAGITMFKHLPKRVFGNIQSKLFPLYFQLCTGMIGIQVRSTKT